MDEDKKDQMFINLLVRIDKKQDIIQGEIVELKLQGSKNTESLIHHVRRTDLLEDLVNKHEKDAELRFSNLERWPIGFKVLLQIATGLSVIAGLIYTISKLI